MKASSLKQKSFLGYLAEKLAEDDVRRSIYVAKRLAEKFSINQEEVRRAILEAEIEYFELQRRSNNG
jgi:uncharacterized Fe-S cluster-containing MiaB family protein